MSEEIREREISREEELRAAAEAERRRTEVRPVQQPRRRRGYRSLFWPVVLIAAGVLWLLSNLGIMTAENWSVLVQLWPILLIAAGLDMIVGRFSAVLGKTVTYVPADPEVYLGILKKVLPNEWHANAVSLLFREIAAGAAAHVTDTFAKLMGRPPISLDQFVRDHINAFR